MRLKAAFILTLLSLPAMAGAAGENADTPDAHSFIHGMTVSCHGSGQIWGTDAMIECMAELKGMGVNWIAIHPYGSIRGDGTSGVADPRRNRMYEDPSWLTRPIAEAHKLGLKIMIKPHIAYWGSKFEWRGTIKFETDEEWDRFFETYEAWITMVAELTDDADAFVVGTELDATVHHEDRWRHIIESVRAKTKAPLTYAANWDSYERVHFWDALDVIGIQSYFPIVNHDRMPTTEELERGWQRVLNKLDAFSRRHDRKILLAELGYNRSSLAASKPWDHRTGGENAEEIQKRCLTVALRAIEGSDSVTGAFLWKWFPRSRRGGRNFLMSTPAMRKIITEEWTAPTNDSSTE